VPKQVIDNNNVMNLGFNEGTVGSVAMLVRMKATSQGSLGSIYFDPAIKMIIWTLIVVEKGAFVLVFMVLNTFKQA
jgi:hypothetical protein